MVRMNLDGAFYCTHAVLPQMLEPQGRHDRQRRLDRGQAGRTRSAGRPTSAAKFGMSRAGSVLVGVEEKDNGVRVSNVYPGEVDTPILETGRSR